MGVPVVALGHAVYDIPDIANQDGLDAFWQNPIAPDEETFSAFRRVLVEGCLIPGGFFSEEVIAKVVRHAVARFEGKTLCRNDMEWLADSRCGDNCYSKARIAGPISYSIARIAAAIPTRKHERFAFSYSIARTVVPFRALEIAARIARSPFGEPNFEKMKEWL